VLIINYQSAAVAGLAHHPLQQAWSGEATTKSLVTGVGLGLVGVVTKPLSGAAELVALTGQGLLQGAGWNPLPMVKLDNNLTRIILYHNLIQSDLHFYSHAKDQSFNILSAIIAHPYDTLGVYYLYSITVTIVSFT